MFLLPRPPQRHLRQPCHSSSPDNESYFQPAFNTSQLASVLKTEASSTQPAQTTSPARCLRRHRLCVTVCLSHSFSTASSNCPQNYNTGRRKFKKSECLSKGPRAKIKKVQIWGKHSFPAL